MRQWGVWDKWYFFFYNGGMWYGGMWHVVRGQMWYVVWWYNGCLVVVLFLGIFFQWSGWYGADAK